MYNRFRIERSPKYGFEVILGVDANIFGGKVHSSSELRVFRPLWSRSDAPCSSIMGIAICHRRKFGQVWESPAPLPEVAGNLRSRKAPFWTFDYHMEKSESFCDVTPGRQAGHWKVRFRGVVQGKQAKIRKLSNFDDPQLRKRTSWRKVDRPRILPGPWTTTWNKQYLLTHPIPVHPMICSLL